MEKGKGLAQPSQNQGLRRMKAPYLDTTDLVKDNSLTLIGRLTNPQEQRMRALIPSLPRKWNLRGRAVGSDLGHDCFQFRFEREDDLQSVLDNRPYHFDYWMVILQKWEPVISSSFPAQIPFWIRIKGLPLHYWHDKVICEIGQELGTLENHELTKTSARVRVSMDGLKGLTKETVMEFDTGEECTLTFEYERLENHCSTCRSLNHLRKQCQATDKGERHRDLAVRPHELEGTNSEKEETFNRGRLRSPQRTNRAATNTYREDHKFHQRVDRHGRPYGDRVETKQTRNPPPERTTPSRESSSRMSEKPREQAPKGMETNSPQYVHHRDSHTQTQSLSKTTYTRNHLLQWREKPRGLDEGRDQQSNPPPVQLRPSVRAANEEWRPPTIQSVPTTEQVLEEIQDATNLYINCADPVESSARRQRVMQSEARGEVHEVAAGIIATAIANLAQSQHTTEQISREVINAPLLLMGPGDTTTGGQPSNVTVTEPPTRTSGRKRGRPAKFRTAGVSPKQNRGASSKKRLLSLVQHSPGRSARELGRGSPKRQSIPQAPSDTVGPSATNNQPKIKLIPAISKKKEDFQAPPHPGP